MREMSEAEAVQRCEERSGFVRRGGMIHPLGSWGIDGESLNWDEVVEDWLNGNDHWLGCEVQYEAGYTEPSKSGQVVITESLLKAVAEKLGYDDQEAA